MKPLYWKLLLILGAVIVGASLVVPKALRKNSAQGVDSVSQSLFLEKSDNNTSFDGSPGISAKIVIAEDKFKALYSTHFTNSSKSSFEISAGFIVGNVTPSYSLSAGTRPTKSRVID